MTRRLIATMAVLLVLVPCSAAAGELAKIPAQWNKPVAPFRIAGNLYYIGSNELSSFLITTADGHIVIDTGAAETLPQVLQNIGRLGFRAEDVKLILTSHAHYDHVGGVAAMKRLTRAKVVISSDDARLAARGGKDDPQFGDSVMFEPFKADRVIRDLEPVRLGDVELTPHLTRGHTKGCTTWSMHVDDGGTQREAIFICSVTAPDYKLVGNAAYPDAIDDYRASFRRLRELKPEIFLAAHGSFFGLMNKKDLLGSATNPFVDPEGYAAFVDRSEREIEKKIAKQSE